MWRVPLIIICLMEIVQTVGMGWAVPESITRIQIVWALSAVTAYLVSISTKRRAISACGWLAVYSVWITSTDWLISYMPPIVVSFETFAFCAVMAWLMMRPEKLPSYSGLNIGVALYTGYHAPWFARALSTFSLPFYGVGICVGNAVLVPRGGILHRIPRPMLSKNWTVFDCDLKPSDTFRCEFDALVGTRVGKLGCMAAVRPLLNRLGLKARTPGTLAMELTSE
ncbi:MAG: hypothetical protein V3T82_08125 [Nitrospinaceae bacterium]